MGRNRKDTDKWMPAKLYRGKSAFEYRPRKGGCIRICSLDTPKHSVLKRFADEYARFVANSGSLSELAGEYFASAKYQSLAPRTRSDYEKYWSGIKPVFGHMDARAIKPEHVRRYMDLKGKSSTVQANRHKALLSAIYSWGFERGKVPSNPCHGVSRFTEASRERYITDAEYLAVYDAAPVPVKVAMEIDYLCAARQADVLKLKKSDLSKDGIFIRQGKTGKRQIKGWTPRLEAAVALAGSIETKVLTTFLIPTQSGTRYTSSGFRTAWDRARAKARQASGMDLDFTFHDLKAKGISDYEGDKQRFSGHKTQAQVAAYDRKTAVVESLNVPTISEAKNSSN